jgi:hypothetical protein
VKKHGRSFTADAGKGALPVQVALKQPLVLVALQVQFNYLAILNGCFATYQRCVLHFTEVSHV